MEFSSGSHIPFFELDVSARIESAALPLLPPALPLLSPALPLLPVISSVFVSVCPSLYLALVVVRYSLERAEFVAHLFLHLIGLRDVQLEITRALGEEYDLLSCGE